MILLGRKQMFVLHYFGHLKPPLLKEVFNLGKNGQKSTSELESSIRKTGKSANFFPKMKENLLIW
jgi:hypothetical protein